MYHQDTQSKGTKVVHVSSMRGWQFTAAMYLLDLPSRLPGSVGEHLGKGWRDLGVSLLVRRGAMVAVPSDRLADFLTPVVGDSSATEIAGRLA